MKLIADYFILPPFLQCEYLFAQIRFRSLCRILGQKILTCKYAITKYTCFFSVWSNSLKNWKFAFSRFHSFQKSLNFLIFYIFANFLIFSNIAFSQNFAVLPNFNFSQILHFCQISPFYRIFNFEKSLYISILIYIFICIYICMYVLGTDQELSY